MSDLAMKKLVRHPSFVVASCASKACVQVLTTQSLENEFRKIDKPKSDIWYMPCSNIPMIHIMTVCHVKAAARDILSRVISSRSRTPQKYTQTPPDKKVLLRNSPYEQW